MKKFFTIIVLTAMSVFVVQCMENEFEPKSLDVFGQDIVFAHDPADPRAPKKQKSEGNNAAIGTEMVNTLICSYCEVRFLNKNNLTAHQTFSYCAKKLQEKKSS